jgi:hypothetical protein
MIMSAGSLLLSENKRVESHAISGVIPRNTYLLDSNISCIDSVYPIFILKGSHKNNFTFFHPIFRLSLSDPQPQNPRKSLAIPVVLRFRIEQS